jgi:hypothetical protein
MRCVGTHNENYWLECGSTAPSAENALLIGMNHISHHAHAYHAGGGFDFGGALMSGAVRFAEWADPRCDRARARAMGRCRLLPYPREYLAHVA